MFYRMKRSDHLIGVLLALSWLINIIGAEFFIGEYKTEQRTVYSSRNQFSEKNPSLHLPQNEIDDDENNELVTSGDRRSMSSFKQRQAVAFSTFNPLTPGGTIYLAFIFLIPLTVGKHLGRRLSSSKTAGLVERLIHKVQQDQQSLYSEMGYVDGNLMLRRAWRDIRHNLARKLLPWRRRNDINIKSKYKKKKKKWKPWKI